MYEPTSTGMSHRLVESFSGGELKFRAVIWSGVSARTRLSFRVPSLLIYDLCLWSSAVLRVPGDPVRLRGGCWHLGVHAQRHSKTHSLTPSLPYTLTPSLTRSLTHYKPASLVHAQRHSKTHSLPIHSPTLSPCTSFTGTCIKTGWNSLTHYKPASRVHAQRHSNIHSLTHSLTHHKPASHVSVIQSASKHLGIELEVPKTATSLSFQALFYTE